MNEHDLIKDYELLKKAISKNTYFDVLHSALIRMQGKAAGVPDFLTYGSKSKRLITEVKLIDLTNDSVLVFFIREMVDQQHAIRITEHLKKYLFNLTKKEINIIVIDDSCSIDLLPEERMNEMGWFKKVKDAK